jgi:hypothetical protein
MKGLDSDTCDDVSLKLSGLIGTFDLIVDLASAAAMGSEYKDHDTMINFAFFISKELQDMFKTITGCDYR